MPDDPNGGDQTSGGSGTQTGGGTGQTGGGTKTGELPAWAEGPKVDEVKTPDREDIRGTSKSGEFGG